MYWIVLSNDTSITTIWQPYQKLWVLKANFHAYLKLGVEFYYENGFGNQQIAPRYKGIDQTYVMSYQYRQSGNPVRSYEYLSVIFILSWSRVLNFTIEMVSGTIN